MTVIDMTGVKALTPLPIGDYVVSLAGVKVKPSNDPDKYANATLEYIVTEDDENLNEETGDTYHGSKAWHNHNLHPNSLWKLKTSLIVFGADPDDISGAFNLEEVVGGLIGNKANCKIVPNQNPAYAPQVAAVTPYDG